MSRMNQNTISLKHSKWIQGTAVVVLVVCIYFGLMPASSSARENDVKTESLYITMRDGVKLAIDVHLPKEAQQGQKVPTLLIQTRYWRSYVILLVKKELYGKDEAFFLKNGYAVVRVDVRGTGASYGSRSVEYSPDEVMDGYDVIEWIVNQPWSNGKVGALGTSYTGTTAELVMAANHPALKCVVPRWPDFDTYTMVCRPYGLVSDQMITTWGKYCSWLDGNKFFRLWARVRPVDADKRGSMLNEAVAQHAENPDIAAGVKSITFRDEELGDSGLSFHSISSLAHKKQIEESGVAIFALASWMDAGMADGALLRFNTYSNPQKVLILGSGHGGRKHASPYVVTNKPLDPIPSYNDQLKMQLRFFDHYLKGADNGVMSGPAITYFTMGEEKFKTTNVWPPEATQRFRLYMNEDNALSSKAPEGAGGSDSYTVDFGVTTGNNDRWMAQMGQPVFGLDDRREMDERMLTYTSPPVPFDVEITGYPVVMLNLTSTHEDGAFLAYLEDIDENGKSVYITEGGLRGIHRKVSESPYNESEPYHSFAQKDAMPLAPGELAEITFKLQPTSVLIRKGHRIRVAVAGADNGIFGRVPTEGTPTITVSINKTHQSYIDLPVLIGGSVKGLADALSEKND